MNKIRRVQDTDLLVRNEEDALSTEIDKEVVIMNLITGKYFTMDAVTSDIWSLLEEKMTFNDLINKLLESYEIDLETCKTETRQLLHKMMAVKLLTVDNTQKA